MELIIIFAFICAILLLKRRMCSILIAFFVLPNNTQTLIKFGKCNNMLFCREVPAFCRYYEIFIEENARRNTSHERINTSRMSSTLSGFVSSLVDARGFSWKGEVREELLPFFTWRLGTTRHTLQRRVTSPPRKWMIFLTQLSNLQ